ncbi:MAG: hypothetical protein IPI53_10245 [Saprospiraceae bacterium]|nr:hypothetical protein [Saprospiraceae bacterium]
MERMFQHLKDINISRIDQFRADAASYQCDDCKVGGENDLHPLYIGARNSYVEKYFDLD